MAVIPEISEQKASSLRRFFYEYVVIGLTIAVVVLFGLYYNLNNQINHILLDTIQRSNLSIERNNDLINKTFNK